ncbi:unnamed protein product [Adineta steineri]|uniref:Uncharacterized protein n=1 Tax=Adineta steineri TaxID=433720 RepID=A0A814BNJ4_9BILA|nr:unnamed protein product [Adineta steineri]CAF0864919.1 unnamed protein product [Adineta steineri]CAF0930712.1 unnamed protein product [Adineta steineri]
MDDFTNYPFPTYLPNKLIAYIFSSFVFLSFILWCIKSIQNHFQPIRLIILLFLSHLTIFCELIIRATIYFTQTNSQTIYILITILYTIGQRSIIIANYTYLVQFSNKKFRFLFLGISLSILLSDILMTPADWFYCFQILPIVLMLFAWSILHPKQSLYVRNQLNIEKVPDEKIVSFIF